MPLIHYTQYVYYPGGGPAADVELTVYIAGGNVAVPLRADKAGTTPLANPVTTDGDGLVSFYAPPGDYTVWLAGTVSFMLPDATETDSAWPGLFVHEQSTPATVWTVNHFFGVQPAVSLMVGGQEAEASVSHPSATQTVITFSQAVSGTAHLRR